jgi:hypothetical protein
LVSGIAFIMQNIHDNCAKQRIFLWQKQTQQFFPCIDKNIPAGIIGYTVFLSYKYNEILLILVANRIEADDSLVWSQAQAVSQ